MLSVYRGKVPRPAHRRHGPTAGARRPKRNQVSPRASTRVNVLTPVARRNTRVQHPVQLHHSRRTASVCAAPIASRSTRNTKQQARQKGLQATHRRWYCVTLVSVPRFKCSTTKGPAAPMKSEQLLPGPRAAAWTARPVARQGQRSACPWHRSALSTRVQRPQRPHSAT